MYSQENNEQFLPYVMENKFVKAGLMIPNRKANINSLREGHNVLYLAMLFFKARCFRRKKSMMSNNHAFSIKALELFATLELNKNRLWESARNGLLTETQKILTDYPNLLHYMYPYERLFFSIPVYGERVMSFCSDNYFKKIFMNVTMVVLFSDKPNTSEVLKYLLSLDIYLSFFYEETNVRFLFLRLCEFDTNTRILKIRLDKHEKLRLFMQKLATTNGHSSKCQNFYTFLEKLMSPQGMKITLSAPFSKYHPSHDGTSRIYSKLFCESRALLFGERTIFANTKSWLRGDGVLFADTREVLSGRRNLFANSRAFFNSRNTYKSEARTETEIARVFLNG